MINGLFETHLYVEDLERSIDFYSNTLELIGMLERKGKPEVGVISYEK